MEISPDKSLAKLQKKLRNTPIRTALFEIFTASKKPMTIGDVQNALMQKNIPAHPTTLYRQVETLLRENRIQKVILQEGALHYEWQEHHHHHFICQQCKRVICIADDLMEAAMEQLSIRLQQKGLHVITHHFSLEGKCQSCIF